MNVAIVGYGAAAIGYLYGILKNPIENLNI